MIVDFIKTYPFIPAFLVGLVPALIWLWFWLKEDLHPEPAKMITLSFLGGMLAVFIALPLQKFVYNYINNQNFSSFFIFASIEEILKFLMVYIIALRNKSVDDEPVDNMIYMIVSALGFVAVENALFLNDLIGKGQFINTIITGNMRFIGASLIHIISSGIIGTAMAFSFYKDKHIKKYYFSIGMIVAILLHTIFNLFIIRSSGGGIFTVFGSVWVGIIILLLIFEKTKTINS